MAFILGVRAVGELNGGVTGALIEPPGMHMCRSLNGGGEEPEDKFLSHGTRELGSAVLMILVAYCDETGLGKEDEVGLGWKDAPGLGWYDEQGLTVAEATMVFVCSTGLHPCERWYTMLTARRRTLNTSNGFVDMRNM